MGEPGGPKRAKRARANWRRERRVGEAGEHWPVWVRASFTIRYWASVGEPSRPKRAKRARANSRRESRVGKAGGHQPVWVPVFLTLRCRPPTTCPRTSEASDCEVSEVKWVIRFGSFVLYETFICYRGCFNLNCYIGKKVQKNFLMGLKIWWSWGSRIFFSKSP